LEGNNFKKLIFEKAQNGRNKTAMGAAHRYKK